MTKTLINVDLSQAELRVMALLSGDEWMIAALQEGEGDFFDTHLMPAAFPNQTAKHGSVNKWKFNDPVDHKECRTQVKAVVYGLSFGRGARAIGKELKIPEREAQAIMDAYLDAAPNLRQWRADVMEAAINPAKRDLLVSPFGRRFQSEVVTTGNFRKIQREALSFLPQATSSDICLSTAIRIHPILVDKGYHIFNVVHDAIMIEGNDNDDAYTIGTYVVKELRKTGEMVFGDRLPFLAEYSIGKSWGDLD